MYCMCWYQISKVIESKRSVRESMDLPCRTGDASGSALLSDVDGELAFFRELFDETLTAEELALAVTLPPVAAFPGGPATDKTVGEWRRIVKRRRQEREHAETQNARLRKAVTTRVREALNVIKLLHKAARLSSQSGFFHPSSLSSTYLGPATDLTEIVRDLDVVAHGVDVVVAARTDPSFEFQNRIVRTATSNAYEKTVDMAWVMPFDVQSITEALLDQSIRLVTRNSQRKIQTVHQDDTLKVVQSISRTKERNGMRVAKHGQLATRLEPSSTNNERRLVLSARGGFVLESKLIVTIHGGGFILVSKVPGHDSTALGPLTRVRWYRRFLAQPCASANLTSQERAQWIHSHVTKWTRKAEHHVEKVMQAMENLLLTRTMTVVQATETGPTVLGTH